MKTPNTDFNDDVAEDLVVEVDPSTLRDDDDDDDENCILSLDLKQIANFRALANNTTGAVVTANNNNNNNNNGIGGGSKRKLNDSNGGSCENSQKRRRTTQSVTFVWFINNFLRLLIEAVNSGINSKIEIPSFVECVKYINAKCEDLTELVSEAELAQFKDYINRRDQYPALNRLTNFNLQLVMVLACSVDNAGYQRQFPFEAFKFFLATQASTVSVEDFSNTNKLNTKKGQKAKCNSNVTGTYLLEYSKAPNELAAFLASAPHKEQKAIQALLEHQISIRPSIYKHLALNDFVQKCVYIKDTVYVDRSDTHVKLAVGTAKHGFILITSSIVALYDGFQFVIPTPNIEREFGPTTINGFKLKKGEYVILDVLISSKCRIIDIVDTNCERYREECYDDRRNILLNIFDNNNLVSGNGVSRVVDIVENTNAESYIQKPKAGYALPSYEYQKPIIVGVIGKTSNNKQALIAYIQDDGSLVYKAKIDISGPPSGVIITRILPKDKELARGRILDGTVETADIKMRMPDGNTVTTKIHRLTGVCGFLFDTTIHVDNRMNNITTNPISNVSEHKTTSSPKESVAETLRTCLTNCSNEEIYDALKDAGVYNIILNMCKGNQLDINSVVLNNTT